MKKNIYKNINLTIGYRWMNSSEQRRKRYKDLYIEKVELTNYSLDIFKKILIPHKMINFLERYYSEPDLDWEGTEYWELLMSRYTGKHKRKLEEKDFIRGKKRLKTFIELCDRLKKEGWNHSRNSRFGSRIGVLVATDEYSHILFNDAESALIKSKERISQKLIDGHHRLSCAFYLNLKNIPTCLHYIRRKNE